MTDQSRPLIDAMRDQIAATPMAVGSRHRLTPFWRVRSRLRAGLVGGASVLAACLLALILFIGASAGPPPAYALTYNPDGTITVTLHDLATGIPQLNAKFAQLGIHEKVIPITANCHSVGGPSSQKADPYASIGPASMSASFTYSRHDRPPLPGFTYVVAARQLPDGKIETWMGQIKPPLPRCFANARGS